MARKTALEESTLHATCILYRRPEFVQWLKDVKLDINPPLAHRVPIGGLEQNSNRFVNELRGRLGRGIATVFGAKVYIIESYACEKVFLGAAHAICEAFSNDVTRYFIEPLKIQQQVASPCEGIQRLMSTGKASTDVPTNAELCRLPQQRASIADRFRLSRAYAAIMTTRIDEFAECGNGYLHGPLGGVSWLDRAVYGPCPPRAVIGPALTPGSERGEMFVGCQARSTGLLLRQRAGRP